MSEKSEPLRKDLLNRLPEIDPSREAEIWRKAQMEADNPESVQRALRAIGDRMNGTAPLPENRDAPMPKLTALQTVSGTTGSASLTPRPARQIGLLPGETGFDAAMNLREYPGQPEEQRALTLTATCLRGLMRPLKSELSESEKARLRQALDSYRALMAPADVETVSARIATLLSHWYVPGGSDKLHEAMIGDWLDILEPYPAWAIKRACDKWLANHKERPTPAAIKESCELHVWMALKRRELEQLEDLAI